MGALEGSHSFSRAQPSAHRYVNSAGFLGQSKINCPVRNPGPFKEVVAQFIGQPDLMNHAATEIWRRPELTRETVRIALVPVVGRRCLVVEVDRGGEVMYCKLRFLNNRIVTSFDGTA